MEADLEPKSVWGHSDRQLHSYVDANFTRSSFHMQSIPVRCSKHYLDWTTTTLICCSQRRLSDREFVKELIYTNCTVSCGKVKYCSSLLDANTMVHYAVRRICLNKKSKVQMGAAGSDIDGSLWSLLCCFWPIHVRVRKAKHEEKSLQGEK